MAVLFVLGILDRLMIHEHDKDKRAFTFAKVGATGEIKIVARRQPFGA